MLEAFSVDDIAETLPLLVPFPTQRMTYEMFCDGSALAENRAPIEIVAVLGAMLLTSTSERYNIAGQRK